MKFKNKFISVFIAVIAFLPLAVLGQQHTLFSHYNFDHFMYNPGAAGNAEGLSGNVFYRNQWAGFENAPRTIFADLHGGLGYSPFALGGQIFNDRAGYLNNTKITLAPAYRFDVGYTGKLGFGLGMTLQRLGLDSGYTAVDPNDNLINTYADGIWNFYFNPGLYYHDEEFYAGLSMPQVLENNWTVNDVLNKPEVSRRHILALVGYDYKINDMWSINPSLLARIERAAPLNFEINSSVTYDELVWLNLGYRSSKMFMAGLGVNINKLFKFGYTYDLNLNPLGGLKARGSHELFAGFNTRANIDTDKDGIVDKFDKCPNEKGLAKFSGCPPPEPPKDSDRDGIPDADDGCPDKFGPRSNNGCPVVKEKDSDGDGVFDKDDKCPNEKGSARNNGCPVVTVPVPEPVPAADSDGDGIIDIEDRCPNVFGSARNGGCPIVIETPAPVIVSDSDGDGIIDTEDRCPNTYGTASNGGCPQPVEYVSDRDGDGIVDSNDRCPDSYGSVNNNGCPEPSAVDTDRDGVTDIYDSCPNEYGPASNNGCPTVTSYSDTDGDGIIDSEDLCPNTYGDRNNQGCPGRADSDGDGIPDPEDACPNTYGAASNNGCPVQQTSDSDGDGIADSEDRCPNTYGTYSNGGCPDITYEQQQIITRAFDNLLFETGSDIIKYSSLSSLNDLAKLLTDNAGYRLRIAGHTDNTGGADTNMDLSRRRAESVRDYLSTKGVQFGNMIVEYYGDTQPIYDNNTDEGRRKNRRVEFELLTY